MRENQKTVHGSFSKPETHLLLLLLLQLLLLQLLLLLILVLMHLLMDLSLSQQLLVLQEARGRVSSVRLSSVQIEASVELWCTECRVASAHLKSAVLGWGAAFKRVQNEISLEFLTKVGSPLDMAQDVNELNVH